MNAVEQTRQWLESFIVKLNICPFAKQPLEDGRIGYYDCDSVELADTLMSLASQIVALEQNDTVETSLFILSKGYKHFDDFLELIEFSDALIDQQQWRGAFQLAHFHPGYQFDGCDFDDPANHTNRSPLPTLHIIRESSITQAHQLHHDLESIPARNIELLRKLATKKEQKKHR
ncbi:DUF1415 family protein [Paraferrimonas haliotis]|uniref:DUF1415 domain-containing protein n=1 Tax=Paraferrimonas haliotis TaxID=2013866 RepID=A0AA37TNH1_9GAMM|nr:DUF1415 domain-containing protein [Paraferrimonas haliotis]GLS82665.1 DUF1415 domain-containing protein [Paraferrimonas haliotis]